MSNLDDKKLKKSPIILSYISLLSIIFLFIEIKTKKSQSDLLDLPEESYKLIELEEENYKSYLKSEHFFIFIHNPWCAWSQKMEKQLTKINLHLKLEPQPFYIGKFDNSIQNIEFITNEIELKKLNYPLVLYYKNGVFIDKYNGNIVFEEVFGWVKKRVYNNEPLFISTLDQYNYKFKTTNKAFMYFPNENELKNLNKEESLEDNEEKSTESNSNELKFFLEASKSQECKDIVFFICNNQELSEKFNSGKNSELAYFKNGNLTDVLTRLTPEQNQKEGNSSRAIKFCNKVLTKNFFKNFDEEAIEATFINKKPALILFRSVFSNKTEYEELKLETLSYMRRDINIIITDIFTKNSYKLANFFGVEDSNLPTIRIVDFKGKNNSPRKYSMSTEINTEHFLEFIDRWENNKLYEFSIKSTTPYSKPIKENSKVLIINPSAFNDKVITNKKNVVVMYYTEWCSHCKKHMILFDILSKKMNQIIYSFVYVNIGTHYDAHIDIKRVPAIYVYPIFEKDSPIEFKDKISIPNLMKFLKKNVEKLDEDL